MAIKVYCDEDSMDQDLVRALRARAMDITTAYDEGMIERDDEDHLDYATEQGRVLLSFNRGDFFRIHTDYLRQSKNHAGIILANQQQYSIGEFMRRILHLNNQLSSEEMENRIEFLSAW